MSNYIIRIAHFYGPSEPVYKNTSFKTYMDAVRATTRLDQKKSYEIWPLAVDPAGCACTECLTGEYVPLDQADRQHVADMLLGKIGNHCSVPAEIEVTVGIGSQVFTLTTEQTSSVLSI
jgi:hypothetical protein